MNNKNPYESLKLDCLENAEPVDAQSTWTLTESRDEVVTIFTSLMASGRWVFGYLVNWANGRTSVMQPSPALGLFSSQREAKLYAVGFMLIYLSFFTMETRTCLHRAEASLIQSELF